MIRGRFFGRSISLDAALFACSLGVYLGTRLVGLTSFPISFLGDEAVQVVDAADLLDGSFRDEYGRPAREPLRAEEVVPRARRAVVRYLARAQEELVARTPLLAGRGPYTVPVEGGDFGPRWTGSGHRPCKGQCEDACQGHATCDQADRDAGRRPSIRVARHSTRNHLLSRR